MNTKFNSVEEYILAQSKEDQKLLNQIKKSILEVVPDAEACISYQMPTFKRNGILIHFAAMKEHIGLYPGPEAIVHFINQIKPYDCSKGSIRVPKTSEMPIQLIQDICFFRMKMLSEKNQKNNSN
jgi:uncharacterized protein YdhG (YjbR/CyaY superfamily)